MIIGKKYYLQIINLGVDLQKSFDSKMALKTKRDHDRHHNNDKLN